MSGPARGRRRGDVLAEALVGDAEHEAVVDAVVARSLPRPRPYTFSPPVLIVVTRPMKA
jgi:hypothetical protein